MVALLVLWVFAVANDDDLGVAVKVVSLKPAYLGLSHACCDRKTAEKRHRHLLAGIVVPQFI